MKPTPPLSAHRVQDYLPRIMVAVFLIPVLAYLGCAIMRLTCPFELEWMEGGSLQMMHRVLSGQPLYGPPTVEFVPYTYTPLYFYASALVSHIIGGEFLPLRTVSFISSLAAFIFLFLLVRRETGSVLGGAAATGLFAATYAVNGNWFDLARIDSLSVALLLGGIWLGLEGSKTRACVAGGILIALAFFTKQVAIIVAAPLFLAVLLRNGRRGLVFTISALIALVFGILLLDWYHDGWFLFYTLTSPRTRWLHNLSWDALGKATVIEFLPIFIIPLGLASPTIWRVMTRPHRKELSLIMVVGGLFLAAAWGRIESINFFNSSIPAHLGVSILFGLTVADFTTRSSSALKSLSLIGAFALQLAILVPFLGALVPQQKEISNFTDYSAFLTSLPTPIYLPDHGYVPALGSANSFAHSIGIMDLMMGGSPQQVSEFRAQMEEALNARRFKTIVCDTHLYPTWFKETLERNYEVNITNNPKGTWIPVLGFQAQPTIFIARQ